MTIGPDSINLDNKVAMVTGGGGGLGAAVAHAFAACGAHVAICDRDAESLGKTAARIEADDGSCLTGVFDIRDEAAVSEFLHQTKNELGTLDILVNNAGGTFLAGFAEVSDKGRAALLDVNLISVMSTIRAALPLMNDGGSIINVTTIEAHRASPGTAIYAAAKAALESLTKTLALEFSARRIRVNALAPDAIPTPGDDALAEEFGGGGYTAYAAKVPLGLGEPDDFAGPAVFLACDLSRWVTGTTIHVDGGSHASSGWTRDAGGTWRP